MPNLIAGILRLNLIAVFLLYAAALVQEFWHPWTSFIRSSLIAFSGILLFVLALTIFVKTWKREWKKPDLAAADLGSLWDCATPAVIAILATAVIGRWEPSRFQFEQPLLQATAYQAGQITDWIKHLL